MIKAIINKEHKEQLISNFISEYHSLLDNDECYNLVMTIAYPDIDVNILPTDVVNIIKDYYNDEVSICYTIIHSRLNNVKFWINDGKIILMQQYTFTMTITITLINGFFVHTHNNYSIDNRIIKSVPKYKLDENIIGTDLITIINYYMAKKYNIDNHITCLSKIFPKITTIKKNYYKCVSVTNNKVFVEKIQIVDEVLFEVIISIVSQLIKCTCTYLKYASTKLKN